MILTLIDDIRDGQGENADLEARNWILDGIELDNVVTTEK